MEKILTVQGLFCGYGNKIVCQDLNVAIEPGTVNLVLGMNGCGKSTLFTVLTGLKKMRNGQIFIDGKKADTKKLQRFTGYVPQENPLVKELTAKDNLLLWYGDKRTLQQDLKDGVLHKLGIDQFVDKKVSALSGGMARRVSIGCALAQAPKLLIMDEPGAALDFECKALLQEWMKEYREGGGTIIMSSHDEADLEMADHIFVMKNGTLQEIDKVLRGSALVEMF